MKKILALTLIVLSVLSSCAYSATIDSQIRTQRRTQNDMKKKIQQYNAIAKQKSKQARELLTQLSRLKRNANDSQTQITDLERESTRLQEAVTSLSRDIENVNAVMNEILNTLRGRLLRIYKYTTAENSLNIIVESYGAHDAVNTAYLLRRFARQDSYMFDELTQKEQELIAARTLLEESKTQIAQKTDELRKKRAEFNTTIKRTDTLLRSVQTEQRKAEEAARELQAAQRAVGNKIIALTNQRKRAQAKPKTVQGTKATIPTQPTQTRTTAGSVKILSWPVNGQVTMQYGSRVHPVFKTKVFNSGIDIKAAAGTPVKAAGPGEVLYKGWLRGFGQVVIIDHGNNLSTVYAHLGGTSVREGASVKTGTVIGKVGNTGTDSAFGLHFEVRRNGTAVNPINYLRR